jgi:Helix-turn-helix domain of resolvase
MTDLELEAPTLQRGRPLKFTPERIEQIFNLVERGKSRDEIAEIIGVTTGTLQVTCSKLGISLRRSTFGLGTGLLRRQQPPRHTNGSPNRSSSQQESEGQCAKGPRPVSKGPRSGEARAGAPEDAAVFALRMEYKGQEQLTDLSLDEEMIGQLAIEAEIRGMRIGELLAALIPEIVKKDLFQLISDDAWPRLEATEGSLFVGAESRPT